MEKNNYKTLTDIINSIIEEKAEIKTTSEELDKQSKGSIRRFLLSNKYERKEYKLYKNKLESKIEDKQQAIDSNSKFLDYICKFNFDVAMQFVANVLTIVEGQKYQNINLRFEDTYLDVALSDTLGYSIMRTDLDNICLITTSQNKLEFESRCSLKHSYEIEKIIKNNKYISIDKVADHYYLFDYQYLKVPNELTKNYPYLEEIIIDLINIRVTNINITEEEAANIVLSQIKTKYEHSINKENDNSFVYKKEK